MSAVFDDKVNGSGKLVATFYDELVPQSLDCLLAVTNGVNDTITTQGDELKTLNASFEMLVTLPALDATTLDEMEMNLLSSEDAEAEEVEPENSEEEKSPKSDGKKALLIKKVRQSYQRAWLSLLASV
jgi:hypothetical protein